jgi:hypothetical protein
MEATLFQTGITNSPSFCKKKEKVAALLLATQKLGCHLVRLGDSEAEE